MKLQKHKKEWISVKFYIQKLFDCYFKKRLFIFSLNNETILSYSFSKHKHNKRLVSELSSLFTNDLKELKISISTNNFNEILYFKLHKPFEEKILKSEYKKGLSLFEKIISSLRLLDLKLLEYEEARLTIIKREVSINQGRIFDKQIWYIKNGMDSVSTLCSRDNRTCARKVDIEISVASRNRISAFVDATDQALFKFPLKPSTPNTKTLKRLRCPPNENSLIKEAEQKSKIFSDKSILQIKANERVIKDSSELIALHDLNEKAKRGL